MIYHLPDADEPIDQGDIIESCPVAAVTAFTVDRLDTATVQLDLHRVLVLTQTCDLANKRTASAVVASVFDAQQLVDQQILKAADVKGPIRGGRVWGLYFLPASTDLGQGEMIVDLRRVHTIQLDLLSVLCQAGKRLAHLQTPYREHLAKHFADTFSRIGLPKPYDTL